MLILDDSSPSAVVVDTSEPPSAASLHAVLLDGWPRLGDRVVRESHDLEQTILSRDDVVVASHACGRLTDVVIDLAASARARVAVLPCCHDLEACDDGGVAGWVAADLAIDVARAIRLRDRGYRVWTQTIPADITPKNRLLLAAPTC
jgi:hypothetical protein